ncbi:protein grainyhead isoform X3 [Zootermopsis nevadensis]|uniref:protein grainyhead isoform X3 n=1 Tax=Zootermopsis nevadensis TaxID=136037 RepID=UPI000B8EDB77|nr:protein grainyhead isoform X3 [Zootermopsis nevadensis]
MTKRGLENCVTVPQDSPPSPPPPMASPAPTSTPPPHQSTSPPIMLATMTPVSVIGLEKEFGDEDDDNQKPVSLYQTHIITSNQLKDEFGPDEDEKNSSDVTYEERVRTPHEQAKELSVRTDETSATETIPQVHLVDPGTGATVVATTTGAPNNATVSVVVQQPQLLNQAYQQQPGAGTTVLVLSELVEDMSPVIGIRKRKDVGGEEYVLGPPLSTRTGTPLARMTDMPPSGEPGGGGAPGDDGGWRTAYYSNEHPLTAATTAMLNISSGGAEESTQSMGFIYEYYKLQQLPATVGDKDKLEIWPTTSSASGGPLLTSHVKASNGLGTGAGHELIAPPPSSSVLSPASPATVSSAADLQGLFLHHHHHQQQQLHHQQFIVKREPEDLSHRHKVSGSPPVLDTGTTGSIIISGKSGSAGGGPRHKLVLVPANGGTAGAVAGDLVVDVVNNNSTTIKEEIPSHRGLNSPQHGSRSINGTPSSTSSLLGADGGTSTAGGPIELITADGLKPPMSYSTQIFTSMNNAQHHGGSGTPSPIPYTDHVPQYTTTAVSQGGGGAGYVTTPSTGSIRATSSAFAVTDPYYREYFTPVSGTSSAEQGYTTTQVRQQIPPYADSPEGPGGGGGGGGASSATTASMMERYVRSTVYHNNKSAVSAATVAGLTVDLPSPDSGIGAEAVTPRDQTAIQQQFDYTDLCQAGPLLSDPALVAQRAAAGQSPGHSNAGGRSRPWHDFGRQNDADKIQIPKLYSQYGFKYNLETPISTSQRREDDRITYINKGQFYGITMEYIPDPDKPLKSQTVKSIVMLMFREEKSPDDEIKAWQFWHGRQHSVKQRILDADTKNSVGLVGCIEEVAHNAIAVYWNPLESTAKINVAVQCLSTDFSSQKGVKGLPLHLQIDTYEDPRDSTIFHRGYCQIKVFCDKGAERKTRDEERRAAKRKMTATGRKKIDELYHPPTERSEFYSMSDLTKPPVLFTPAEDIDKVSWLTSMELQGFYGHETDSSSDKKDGIIDGANLSTDGTVFSSPPIKRAKMMAAPSLNERVMLYVRQETDDVYTPLHVIPPTTQGLLNAIENKYKISTSSISNLYRKNKKGIIAKIDDDMLKYYCNEDLFLLEIKQVEGEDAFEVTLIELIDH